MIIDKYLYFRTQADQDSDDGIDDSLYLPARQIKAIVPTSTTALTIFFESMYNTYTGGANEVVISDSVVINCTQGKVRQVMETLVRAMSSTAPLYNYGVITVADDVTTTYLTSAAGADETVTAKTLDSGITSCGAITIAAANS